MTLGKIFIVWNWQIWMNSAIFFQPDILSNLYKSLQDISNPKANKMNLYMSLNHLQMSHVVRKPVNAIC